MSAPKLHNVMWPGLVKIKPNLKAILLPYRARAKIALNSARRYARENPALYNRCKHAVEKRGRCKRGNEDKSHIQLWGIQGTFAQAFMRIAKRLKLIGSKTVHHTATVHTATENCLRQMIHSPGKPQNRHQGCGYSLFRQMTIETHANHQRGDTT
jgi:hypothetical protein